MFKPVEAHPDFVKMETALLKHWYQSGIVKKYLHKNAKAKKKFSFLDGPITANNPMGVHHARGRTYKDLWQRYFTMKGYKQRYQNGFDCQGLWVEVEVEKELGFKNKQDIVKYGVEKFVDKCKERVRKYSAIQIEQSRRLGMWMDWDNSYFTMSDENNYWIWKFLKVCHQRGWIYKGHDVVPWCWRCETAISQHEILTEDYKQVTHDSIYLALPIEGKDESLLVWTTTPWTVPANVAVAVDKDFDYSLAQTKTGKKVWLLDSLVQTVLKDDFEKTLKTVKGKDLVGLKYVPPFKDLPVVAAAKQSQPDKIHMVVATDKLIMPITTTEGTGLVHTATGTGAEDFQLGKKLGLPVIPAIADDARYLDGFGGLTGKNAKKNPEAILAGLDKKFVYKIVSYSHRYPACWRCKTELVWKVTDEWYVDMDKGLRQQIIKVAKSINWIPAFGLERELDWLNHMHDWLISKKNRFWGLALPIYECSECGRIEVIGGREELKQRAVAGWDKFEGHTPHKPWIDAVKIKCGQCGAEVSRVEPVGNPWLDAGIVPFSTMGGDWFPADFITEAFPGQFKNWFYAMLVMATVLKTARPYKTVLGYESVVGEDGRAMHKSWGNAIEFNEGAQKIGADVMRWLYSRCLPTAVLSFGYSPAGEVRRQFVLILWNSYRFFVSLARADAWRPRLDPRSSHVLDKWIISRLQQTIKTVTESLDKYLSAPATTAVEEFVSDFSTWYIRRSRDRKAEAYPTMYRVLVTLARVLAPFMPFLADAIYTNLTGEESVHLTAWPKAEAKLINSQLEKNMAEVRLLVEAIHRARKEAGIKVRQPLSKATVSLTSLSRPLRQLVLEETNLKTLVFKPRVGEISVRLDTRISPQLKAEGEAREIVRMIQAGRKQAATGLNELVDVELPAPPAGGPAWPKDYTAYIKKQALVKDLRAGASFKLIRL